MSLAVPSVYVGNLDERVNEQILYDHFKEVGSIVSVRVCTDAQSGKSMKYGYVNFQNPIDAEKAIESKNITNLIGSYIRVNHIERDPLKRRTGAGNVVVKHLPPAFDILALKELFSKFGRITSLNIALNEDGTSRGYAHVQFENTQSAEDAIAEMNNQEIEGKAICCEKYRLDFQEERKKNYSNLYIKNIDSNVTEDILKAYYSQFGTISSLAIRRTAEGASLNVAYVAFESHVSALNAKEATNEKIIPELSKNGTEPLLVDRFIPKSERKRLKDEQRRQRAAENAKFPNLYVKNFDEHVTSDILKGLFSRYGEVMSARVMVDPITKVSRCFGFVSVKDNQVATRCLQELHGSNVLSQRPLYIGRAMKKDTRRQMMEDRARRMNQNTFNPMQGFNPNLMAQQQRPLISQLNPMINQQIIGQPGIPGNRMMMRPINPIQQQQQQQQQQQRQRPIQQIMNPAQMAQLNFQQQQLQQTQLQQQQFQQQLQQQQQQQQQMQQQAPNSSIISKMSPEQARNVLGERIYTFIYSEHPNEASKITGMILEMDLNEVCNLLENPQLLRAKVAEALEVLAKHAGHH